MDLGNSCQQMLKPSGERLLGHYSRGIITLTQSPLIKQRISLRGGDQTRGVKANAQHRLQSIFVKKDLS